MKKIVDFSCTYDNAAGISPEVTERLNLSFPDAYLHSETMEVLAREIKRQEGSTFCELPFCHTVEAEAMGGKIRMGDGRTGPRAGTPVCRTWQDVLELPDIDFSEGRIAQVLTACKNLCSQGETVVLDISGPFTILNSLMDGKDLFPLMRKAPEAMERILRKMEENIFAFAVEAAGAGVKMISYADSAGGVNILGPKHGAWIAEVFTYPLMKKLEAALPEDVLVLLCPKTAFVLLGIEKAEWEDISLSGAMTYAQGCEEAAGKTRFVGQMCIRNTRYMLENRKIKGLRLL